jgi:hypothetical protein
MRKCVEEKSALKKKNYFVNKEIYENKSITSTSDCDDLDEDNCGKIRTEDEKNGNECGDGKQWELIKEIKNA